MSTYQIKELKRIMITSSDAGVFFVPLNEDQYVYNLQGIEAQVFKAVYREKNKPVEYALSIFVEENPFDLSELKKFTRELLLDLEGKKLIGLSENP